VFSKLVVLYSNLLWLTVGEYGVPKRWYFLFTKSYWCSKYSSDDGGGVMHQNTELELGNEGNVFRYAYCVKLLEDCIFRFTVFLCFLNVLYSVVGFCVKL